MKGAMQMDHYFKTSIGLKALSVPYLEDKQCSESLWLKMSTTISHISIYFNPKHYLSRNLIRDEQEKLFWFNLPANN